MHVLFTGLGSIGQRHLRILREHESEFTISAYRHSNESDSIDGVQEFTDLGTALDAEPNIAFITNPTYRHVDTALACAKAGCDLFIEKPLSHTLDGVDELISMTEKQNLVTYMGCQHRFNPVLQQVEELLNTTDNQEVYSFRATAGSYLPDWRPNQDYRESYSADSSQGGGVVLDLIHELDYVHWLFGRITDVSGHTARCSDLEISVEDTAEIVLRTSDGAMGSVHLDYVRPVACRSLEIIRADSVVTADLDSGTVSLNDGTETYCWSFDFDRDDLFTAQLDYFIDHVIAGTSCENDIHEGKRVLQIALAAKERYSGE